MKTRLFSILIILAIGLAGFTQPAQAQAYTTSFTTSITYQNVGTAPTTVLTILFYASPDDTTPIQIDRDNLAVGAGSSVYIGNEADIGAGFRGSAVMQADQPLLATLVQVPAAGAVKVRPMSNGFDAGAGQSLIATVLKNTFGQNTVFSVQNVDSELNNIDINFYDTAAVLKFQVVDEPLEPGAAYYFDMAADPLITDASFNGSAVVTATRADASEGAIVSSAMELDITLRGAKAFEGVAQGATDFFMPSALCKFNSSGFIQDTSYAVQNTSLTTATTVTVTFSNDVTYSQPIGAGAKASFVTCSAPGMPENFIGSAIVHSDTTPVIAVGKAYNGGLSTAFVGAAAGSGTAKVALPYVRWTSTANYNTGNWQRSFIAIQNIGTAAITDDIVVQYVDCHGAVVGTHTISTDVAVGGKVNSFASSATPAITELNLCDGGPNYGAGALVQGPAGSELSVIVRVQTMDTTYNVSVGEDYNGLNVP